MEARNLPPVTEALLAELERLHDPEPPPCRECGFPLEIAGPSLPGSYLCSSPEAFPDGKSGLQRAAALAHRRASRWDRPRGPVPDPRQRTSAARASTRGSGGGHGLARAQIARHGRDRYPTAALQALKACAETGELADAVLKYADSPSPENLERVREEYADAGLALFALGDKLGLDLIVSMMRLVENDERVFRAHPGSGKSDAVRALSAFWAAHPDAAAARDRVLEERGAALHAAAETWDHRAAGGQERAVRTDRFRSCPDGGTCHHLCRQDGPCFRVRYCGPLSGVFPGDSWPEDVRAAGAGGEALPS
jgi:NTP pyrophosphatase (non-canonical NTP hydrolase)